MEKRKKKSYNEKSIRKFMRGFISFYVDFLLIFCKNPSSSNRIEIVSKSRSIKIIEFFDFSAQFPFFFCKYQTS